MLHFPHGDVNLHVCRARQVIHVDDFLQAESVIENRVRGQPQYIGFQLGNLWGESLEYAHRLGSLNGFQSEVDPDGAIRLVVSHQDPGVPNWINTVGHSQGTMCFRWIRAEEHPQPRTRVVKRSELAETRP